MNCTKSLIETPPDDPGGGGLFDAGDPQSVVTSAVVCANQLADIIRKQKLFAVVKGKRYVLAEGWCVLGAMAGILPREVSVEEDTDGNIIARVELIRISDLAVVGAATGMLGTDERDWQKRPKFMRRSMAVTRATGKAFRLSLGWIMRLAGYEATPAEEIGGSGGTGSGMCDPPSSPAAKDSGKPGGMVIDMVSNDNAHTIDLLSPSTSAQHEKIKAVCKRLQLPVTSAKTLVKKYGADRLSGLSVADADRVLADLEAYESESDCPF